MMGTFLQSPVFQLILGPMTKVYKGQIAKRNAQFDAGQGVVTLDRPVISVGNLSVGGTGKSPMVAHVVSVLREANHHPCIAMRGYGAKHTARGTSDEADEYGAHFDDLPIVAQPNRTEGLIELFCSERGQAVDSIVLDDGFQHRRIARTLDIVLIDATRSPLRDSLLPAGRLREPMASLARAHVVVLTHAESADHVELADIQRSVSEINPEAVVVVAEHAWSGFDVTGVDEAAPLDWLSGKRVLPVCAIGNPRPFLNEVAQRSGSQAAPIQLRDHDPYKAGTVAKIRKAAAGCDAVVCTAKDWAKLGHEPTESWPCPVVRPRLSIRFREGGDRLDELILKAASEPAE